MNPELRTLKLKTSTDNRNIDEQPLLSWMSTNGWTSLECSGRRVPGGLGLEWLKFRQKRQSSTLVKSRLSWI